MFLSALCTIYLTVGQHYLHCEVRYLHVVSGERYIATEKKYWKADGNQYASCYGEGHPEQVVFKDLGMHVCTWSRGLFIDGFEVGSTANWTRSVE